MFIFMQLVERHIIKKENKCYKELDDLCFKAKNLYNATLYAVRQHFFDTEKYLKYKHIQKDFQDNNQFDYRKLPANVSQQVMRLVDQNFKSFFESLKSYKVNPEKFKSVPKIPKYLHKTKGRIVTTFTHHVISKRYLDKHKQIKLTGLDNFTISTNLSYNQIQQVRIVPRLNYYYVVEIIYKANELPIKNDNGKYSGIDLGVNNLAAVSSNVTTPFIINGRPIKSINYYYNKKKATLQSQQKDNNYDINKNKLRSLELKRKNKIDDYLHKASRLLVNHLVSNQINTLIIGHNKEQKQDINNGKVNNQNFVQIPFNRFIYMLQYKCKFEGINVVITEESYTSKSSFFDNDILPKYKKNCNKEYKFQGKRIKRGLYKTSKNILINADINGSLNIIRKVIPNVSVAEYGIQVCGTPVVHTVLRNGVQCISL